MKNLLFSFVSLIALFVFTGCSGKQDGASISLPPDRVELSQERCKQVHNQTPEHCTQTEYHLLRIMSSSNLAKYGMKHKNFNNSNSAFMQTAASSTLFLKKKYFAIVEPTFISNVNGSLVNTPKEFFANCDIDMITFLSNRDPCKIHTNRYGVTAGGTIAIFEQRPSDVLVYDAQEVLQYLKAEGRYDEENTVYTYKLESLTEEQFEKLSDRFKRIYNN